MRQRGRQSAKKSLLSLQQCGAPAPEIPQTIQGRPRLPKAPPLQYLSAAQYMQTAEICSGFLYDRFRDCTPGYIQVNHVTVSPLYLWITTFLEKAQLRLYIIAAALELLERVIYVQSPLTRGIMGHELFVAACMVASKVVDDQAPRARNWRWAASEVVTLARLVEVEKVILHSVEWLVQFEPERLQETGRSLFGSVKLRNETFVYDTMPWLS